MSYEQTVDFDYTQDEDVPTFICQSLFSSFNILLYVCLSLLNLMGKPKITYREKVFFHHDIHDTARVPFHLY